MPRLLNVNNYHYRRGGSELVYLNHAALMESQGWEVGYFSMHHPQNVQTPWSKYFIEELEFGNSYSLPSKALMATKVVYSFEAQRKLRALLSDFPADLAHLHCINHHLSPSILPTLHEAGIPAVMTAHDLKLACPAYKMLNDSGICEKCRDGSLLNVVRNKCIRGSTSASAIIAVESLVHRHLDTYRKYLAKVIVPSQFFLDKLSEWGWAKDKLIYIPNYVDSETFAPSYVPGKAFLYFGRLAPEKGIGTLIRSAAAAKVALDIVGTGPIEDELRHLAADCDAQVRFLGYKTGNELMDLIRAARAVVLPSEWYENAPMSVLESMAMGKPVIGARIGGIPEMIIEESTGWTFTSRSTEELTDRLARVNAMTEAQLSRCGRAARAFVSERFNRRQYLNAVLNLYATLGVASSPMVQQMPSRYPDELPVK